LARRKPKGLREYLVRVFNGMAWGLFSSLLIGLIIKTVRDPDWQ